MKAVQNRLEQLQCLQATKNCDSEDCTGGVKVFHARAAVTENARSLIVKCTVH